MAFHAFSRFEAEAGAIDTSVGKEQYKPTAERRICHILYHLDLEQLL